MKIESKNSKVMVELYDIEQGGLFRYNSSIHVKTDLWNCDTDEILCIALEIGEGYYLDGDTKVESVVGTLIIEN